MHAARLSPRCAAISKTSSRSHVGLAPRRSTPRIRKPSYQRKVSAGSREGGEGLWPIHPGSAAVYQSTGSPASAKLDRKGRADRPGFVAKCSCASPHARDLNREMAIACPENVGGRPARKATKQIARLATTIDKSQQSQPDGGFPFRTQ